MKGANRWAAFGSQKPILRTHPSRLLHWWFNCFKIFLNKCNLKIVTSVWIFLPQLVWLFLQYALCLTHVIIIAQHRSQPINVIPPAMRCSKSNHLIFGGYLAQSSWTTWISLFLPNFSRLLLVDRLHQCYIIIIESISVFYFVELALRDLGDEGKMHRDSFKI